MYKELLGIVRNHPDDVPENDNSPVEETKDAKQRQKWANQEKYVPNMTEVVEDESELFASTKGPLFKDAFTFEVEGNQIESVDDVHTHLIKELGEDKVNKCYPILRDFGDRILNDDN